VTDDRVHRVGGKLLPVTPAAVLDVWADLVGALHAHGPAPGEEGEAAAW
jgi:hypothetical protein